MLCNRLFEIRKNKGFTQQQLADLVGCSRQTINYVENFLMIPKVNFGFAAFSGS